MLDQYNRDITYLRISVTDRCNLRCSYCMPEEGMMCLDKSELLSISDISRIGEKASALGINKIRLTGGEPLIRKDIVEIVASLAKIEGITDLALTTNGLLLNKLAKPLANAGLKRINISLDTIDKNQFKTITRIGNLNDVLAGIEAAKQAGLSPIKINCVVEESQFEKNAQGVAAYCKANDLHVRFIKKMNLEKGIYHPVIGGEGGNCNSCNRIRITADGKVKPCLFSDEEYDLKKDDISTVLKMAIENKPKCGVINNKQNFYNIGG